MPEIGKLRQDMIAQAERLQRERAAEQREGWKMPIAGLAGGAALFGAGAAFMRAITP